MALRQADYRNLTWLAIGIAVLALLYLLAPVLTPFFLAAILAYIWQPLVQWLARRGVPRALASILVMVIEVLLLVPLVVKEISLLIRQLPAFLDRLNATLAPWIRQHMGIAVNLDFASVREYITASLQTSEGLGVKLLASLRIGGLGLLGVFATAVLV